MPDECALEAPAQRLMYICVSVRVPAAHGVVLCVLNVVKGWLSPHPLKKPTKEGKAAWGRASTGRALLVEMVSGCVQAHQGICIMGVRFLCISYTSVKLDFKKLCCPPTVFADTLGPGHHRGSVRPLPGLVHTIHSDGHPTPRLPRGQGIGHQAATGLAVAAGLHGGHGRSLGQCGDGGLAWRFCGAVPARAEPFPGGPGWEENGGEGTGGERTLPEGLLRTPPALPSQ